MDGSEAALALRFDERHNIARSGGRFILDHESKNGVFSGLAGSIPRTLNPIRYAKQSGDFLQIPPPDQVLHLASPQALGSRRVRLHSFVLGRRLPSHRRHGRRMRLGADDVALRGGRQFTD